MPPRSDGSLPWRQGSVIAPKDANRLGLISEADKFAIVITHDCDCVAGEGDEPLLEVMIGAEIPELNGNLTFAKSTRILHLGLSGCNKQIEIHSSTRAIISKSVLSDISPALEFTISDQEKRTLARWLAARYDRAAFPDELIRRLEKVRKPFREAAKKHGAQIIGIYVDFSPREELSPESIEPYELFIIVVYPSRTPGAAIPAKAIADKLRLKFEEKYKTVAREAEREWNEIELSQCEIASDIEFTLQDAMSYSIYRLDDLSLRDDPQGELA